MKHIIKEEVREILSEKIFTRDDDFRLWMEYIKKHSPCAIDEIGHLIPEYLQNIPSQKTISRFRAIIQNKELQHLPTSFLIARQRHISWRKWKNYIRLQNLFIYHPGV